ncbi:hypothetical protein KAU11_09610 [Candidatus Babeliales bacterium]|nr:hypothetical protein [Candidatus Babeliales bacterium]
MRIIRGFTKSDDLFLTESDLARLLAGETLRGKALVVKLEPEANKDLESQGKG